MILVAWVRHKLGLDLKDRADALKERKLHNERSVNGAIEAFKQFAKDAER